MPLQTCQLLPWPALDPNNWELSPGLSDPGKQRAGFPHAGLMGWLTVTGLGSWALAELGQGGGDPLLGSGCIHFGWDLAHMTRARVDMPPWLASASGLVARGLWPVLTL